MWARWTLWITLGETLGLTASLAIMGLAVSWAPTPALAVPWALGLAMIGGLVEGALFGWAQSQVLAERIPGFPRARFVQASALTASVCWLLGMLPSQLMDLAAGTAAPTAASPPAELPLGITLLLAAAMGAVLGPILASGPAWVVRRHMTGLGVWLGAHAGGWAAGMVTVFLVLGLVPDEAGTASWLAAGALAALLTSAVVGAVTGLGLPAWGPRETSPTPAEG